MNENYVDIRVFYLLIGLISVCFAILIATTPDRITRNATAYDWACYHGEKVLLTCQSGYTEDWCKCGYWKYAFPKELNEYSVTDCPCGAYTPLWSNGENKSKAGQMEIIS